MKKKIYKNDYFNFKLQSQFLLLSDLIKSFLFIFTIYGGVLYFNFANMDDYYFFAYEHSSIKSTQNHPQFWQFIETARYSSIFIWGLLFKISKTLSDLSIVRFIGLIFLSFSLFLSLALVRYLNLKKISIYCIYILYTSPGFGWAFLWILGIPIIFAQFLLPVAYVLLYKSYQLKWNTTSKSERKIKIIFFFFSFLILYLNLTIYPYAVELYLFFIIVHILFDNSKNKKDIISFFYLAIVNFILSSIFYIIAHKFIITPIIKKFIRSDFGNFEVSYLTSLKLNLNLSSFFMRIYESIKFTIFEYFQFYNIKYFSFFLISLLTIYFIKYFNKISINRIFLIKILLILTLFLLSISPYLLSKNLTNISYRIIYGFCGLLTVITIYFLEKVIIKSKYLKFLNIILIFLVLYFGIVQQYRLILSAKSANFEQFYAEIKIKEWINQNKKFPENINVVINADSYSPSFSGRTSLGEAYFLSTSNNRYHFSWLLVEILKKNYKVYPVMVISETNVNCSNTDSNVILLSYYNKQINTTINDCLEKKNTLILDYSLIKKN